MEREPGLQNFKMNTRDLIMILIMVFGWGGSYFSLSQKVDSIKEKMDEDRVYMDKNIVPRSEHNQRDEFNNQRFKNIEETVNFLNTKVMDLMQKEYERKELK